MKRQPSPVSRHLSSNINKNNITKDRATQLHLHGSWPEDLRSSSSLRNQSIQPGSDCHLCLQPGLCLRTGGVTSPSPHALFSFPRVPPCLGGLKLQSLPLLLISTDPGCFETEAPSIQPSSSLDQDHRLIPPPDYPIPGAPVPLLLTALAPLPDGSELVCQMQRLLPPDLRPGATMRSHHKRAVDATESGSGVKQQQQGRERRGSSHASTRSSDNAITLRDT